MKWCSIVCPADPRYRIDLDAGQVFTSGVGLGTPAVVRGPQGAVGTYDRALLTSTLLREAETTAIPPDIARWLHAVFDQVGTFLGGVHTGAAPRIAPDLTLTHPATTR